MSKIRHPRPRPVGRVPYSDLILMSNGSVCAPLEWWDDEDDEVEPDDPNVCSVIICEGGRQLLVDLEDLPIVGIH